MLLAGLRWPHAPLPRLPAELLVSACVIAGLTLQKMHMKHMAAKLHDLNDAWPTGPFATAIFKVNMFYFFLFGIWVGGCGTCMAGLAAAALGGPRCHPMPCS